MADRRLIVEGNFKYPKPLTLKFNKEFNCRNG